MINKSDSRFTVVRFVITRMITDRLLRLLVLAFRDSVITLSAIAYNVNNNLDEVLLAPVCAVYYGNSALVNYHTIEVSSS